MSEEEKEKTAAPTAAEEEKETSAAPTAAAAEGEQTGPAFRIENILIKNLSLEMPEKVVAPVFRADPTVKMELRNSSRALSRDNYYEVTLEITFRLQNGEEVQLLIETAQAGILLLQNVNANQREEILNIHAPEMLYPYSCQLICEMMMRAGAPRMFLPPFNFRSLYERKLRAMKEKIAADNDNGKQDLAS